MSVNFTVASNSFSLDVTNAEDDVLLKKLAVEINDIDRATLVVGAYEKTVKPTLSESEQQTFEAWIVHNIYYLGSKSFNHDVFFKELSNTHPLQKNAAFKSAFVAFNEMIAFQSPSKAAATARKVKNIAILYPGFGGGGHMAPANALGKELTKLGYKVKLIDVDVIAEPYDPKINGLARGHIYSEVYQKEGDIGKFHLLMEEGDRKQKLSDRRFMSDLTGILNDFNTDHIFTVAHHEPHHAYLAYRLNVPMTFVHTDNQFFDSLGHIAETQKKQAALNKEYSPLVKFTVPKNSAIKDFFKCFSSYQVDTQNASKQPPSWEKTLFKPDFVSQLDELNIPVRHSFHAVTPEEKKALKKELKIPPNSNVCKLAMGKNGLPEQIMEILRQFYQERLQATKPLHLVIICGKNEMLRKEIVGFLALHSLADSKLTIEVKGFLDEKEMSKYDKVSDVWVTKPGGSTAAEAAEMHKQMLYVYDAHHPWELSNAKYLEKMGLARELNKNDSIVKQVEARAKFADTIPIMPKGDWKKQLKQILLNRGGQAQQKAIDSQKVQKKNAVFRQIFDDVGISNIGNSCYMNAGIQQLLASRDFINLIRGPLLDIHGESEDERQARENLKLELNAVITEMENGDEELIRQAMVRLRATIFSDFSRAHLNTDLQGNIEGQHDGTAFIETILRSVAPRLQLQETRTFMYNNVQHSLAMEPDFDSILRVPVLENTDLQGTFDYLFNPRNVFDPDYRPDIDGNGHQISVGRYRTSTQIVGRIPDSITVQFKRFDENGERDDRPIPCPHHGRVDLTYACPPNLLQNGQRVEYQVVSFEKHIGHAKKGGHYVTYRLGEDGQWRLYDDGEVRIVSQHEAEFQMQTPYNLTLNRVAG